MERKLKATFFRFGKLRRGFSENHRDCCRVLAMRIYRRLTLTFSEIDKVLSLSKQTCACAGISDLKLIAGEFKATPFHGFGRWFTNVLRVTSAFKRWSRIFKLINLMFVVDFRAWWCSSIKKHKSVEWKVVKTLQGLELFSREGAWRQQVLCFRPTSSSTVRNHSVSNLSKIPAHSLNQSLIAWIFYF